MWKAGAWVCSVLVFALLSAPSLACEWSYLIWIPRSPTADPLYRFLKGTKVGYIDGTGRVVIPAILPSGGEFHDGLLEIGVYDGVYVDKFGKKVIDEGLYRGWSFSEGLAVAAKEDKGKWGYINTKGEWAIPPRFGWSRADYVSSFEGGFASIEVAGRYGYIDHSGDFVIPPKLYLGDSFHEGFARVVAEGPCLYADLESGCPDVRELPPDVALDSLHPCKFAFIDARGQIISKNRFDGAKSFSQGLAPVKVGKLWGYIDQTGKVVIAPKYTEEEGFSDGLARVSLAGHFGYIDQHGTVVIPAQFDYAESFAEGAAVVGNGKSVYWYIDRTGKEVFNDRFAAASPFFKGLAHVRRLTKTPQFAYIDHTGKPIFAYTP